jgi:hypothetical protein
LYRQKKMPAKKERTGVVNIIRQRQNLAQNTAGAVTGLGVLLAISKTDCGSIQGIRPLLSASIQTRGKIGYE